jgi:hypothetical protein
MDKKLNKMVAKFRDLGETKFKIREVLENAKT